MRLAILATVLSGTVLLAADPSVWDGVYTTAQAERGKSSYRASCSSCHSTDMKGGDGGDEPAPALQRDAFGVSRRDVANLYGYIRSDMPKSDPMSLSDQTYADLVAFILQQNGYPAGSSELPTDPAALKRIAITRKPQ